MTFWTLVTGIAKPFPNFGNGNEKLHSQLLEMGIRNPIPNIWERERKLRSRLLVMGINWWYFRECLGPGMTFKVQI